MVNRGRSLALPVLALCAATGTALFAVTNAFCGGGLSTFQALRLDDTSSSVAMRARMDTKAAKSPVQKNFVSAKQKQTKRSLERQSKDNKKKKMGVESWPIDIPDGVTMLHIEFDEWNGGGFPKPGNPGVINFIALLQLKLGQKVRVVANYRKALKELSPTGDWRPGSFEVVNLNKSELMFSKLQTGISIFQDQVGLDEMIHKLDQQLETA
mmetsp:Transcript_72892/g.131307  ORF Transcript_72892/g.131307 Transcript_72892/m.131307 type:complete len:211 (+) Transcript_72892:128-760(+)